MNKLEEDRLDPNKLLKYVNKEELNSPNRGKLKIYFGAAPGVGKTYTMLEQAILQRQEGVDVVVGIVETHARQETQKLLQQLEILPQIAINYKNKSLLEFNLDGAIKRAPKLLLVDEMAHSNVPGSRHNKRWQDIEELLAKGIDVYTTLNVQHVESLNNIVTDLLGTVVRETVPDPMLEKAHAIELVDLPPDELLKRLQEGKVYVATDLGMAIEHFFRPNNLITLRELALRLTAEQVNTEVILHREGKSIEKIWPIKERLLVCINPDLNSAKLIRIAFRIAKRLKAEWIAIYIETPNINFSITERDNLIKHFQLVEQLGGKAVTIGGVNIVKEIITFAKERSITRIILGKNNKSSWWLELFKPSLASSLVRLSDTIDLQIIKSEYANKDHNQKSKKNHKFNSSFNIVATISVIIISIIINSLLFNYLGLKIKWQDPHYLISLFIIVILLQSIWNLIGFIKQQADFFRLREHRMAIMHMLNKQLVCTRGINNLLDAAMLHIADLFNSKVLVLLPYGSSNKNSKLVVYNNHNSNYATLTTKDYSVAAWVYKSKQPAGLGTQTLPETDAVYIPLLGAKGVFGVIRVLPKDPNMLLEPEQMHILEIFCHQTAMALEVDRLQIEAHKTDIQLETDRVLNVLLKSISENMHIPVTEIMHAADRLMKIGKEQNTSSLLLSIKELGNFIYKHSQDLHLLVNKIVQVIHLETTSTVDKELNSLVTVINIAIKNLSTVLSNRTIKLNIPDNFPKVLFNPVFLKEVFLNVIENAVKYTPANTSIEISAEIANDLVVIGVKDQGPGLATEEIDKVFTKFYRGQTITNIKGMGLGLAICEKIILLHGGKIWIENNPTGGAICWFTIPVS